MINVLQWILTLVVPMISKIHPHHLIPHLLNTIPPQAYSSPTTHKDNQITRDSPHPLTWQQTDQCPIDQLCHNCIEVGLHLTANCPDLIPSSEQRNVNAVYTDAFREFTSFDNDHAIEDNP